MKWVCSADCDLIYFAIPILFINIYYSCFSKWFLRIIILGLPVKVEFFSTSNFVWDFLYHFLEWTDIFTDHHHHCVLFDLFTFWFAYSLASNERKHTLKNEVTTGQWLMSIKFQRIYPNKHFNLKEKKKRKNQAINVNSEYRIQIILIDI